MNLAEIKLDLFRRIDKLDEQELEKIYDKFLALLNTTSIYKLSRPEKNVIEEAMTKSNIKKSHSRQEMIEEARHKYPNLNFK